jgi:hypothetical protein
MKEFESAENMCSAGNAMADSWIRNRNFRIFTFVLIMSVFILCMCGCACCFMNLKQSKLDM